MRRRRRGRPWGKRRGGRAAPLGARGATGEGRRRAGGGGQRDGGEGARRRGTPVALGGYGRDGEHR